MPVAIARQGSATAADLTGRPGDPFAEVIDGIVVEKASPSAEHGTTQSALLATLWQRFYGSGGGDRPGGCWLMTEVEVELEQHEVYRPDVVGWRKDRVPVRPAGRPVRARPDWVCEVLSATNSDNDVVVKFRAYHRNRVPHYWLLDPEGHTLVVYRWTEAGYLAVLTAKRDETVRAEPFDAVEIRVGVLFGDEA
jgi:Uma2 family endonuclease